MKPILSLTIAVLVAIPAYAAGSHQVKGYITQNGTYIAPHYQTNPDRSVWNNWSTQGNVNPYTGQAGTVNPYTYSIPTYQYQTPTYPVYQPYQPYQYKTYGSR
jgi:hypothetical protein